MDNRKSIKSGIINVYKEAGYTSHDVVAKMRGILGMKKIGHTGTLDPDATGVLPVCIGKATKVCELLTGEDKTYRCVMLLGQCTDTQDASGCVLSECPVNLTEKAVEEAARSFLGAYDQVPPMYSALKVQGKKLYELAGRKRGGACPPQGYDSPVRGDIHRSAQGCDGGNLLPGDLHPYPLP